jgi:hypothetical protein
MRKISEGGRDERNEKNERVGAIDWEVNFKARSVTREMRHRKDADRDFQSAKSK